MLRKISWDVTCSPIIFEEIIKNTCHVSMITSNYFIMTIHQLLQLGWDQLYHGHVSHDWAKAINSVHPTLHHMGKEVMILLQCIIWQYVLDTWTLWNQHLHHTANQLNLPDFFQAARSLYEQCDWLNPDAQAALYQQPLEQILELPASCLEHWVIKVIKILINNWKLQTASMTQHHRYPCFLPSTDSAKWWSSTPIGSPVALHQCGSSLYALVLER